MAYYLWPDGDYQCTEDDPTPYSWKSDDFIVVEIPEDSGEDDDEYMHQLHLEINLGYSCEKRTII